MGKMILVMVCQRFAPSAEAASSSSVSISLKTGCTVRTTNGKPIKINARVIPIGCKPLEFLEVQDIDQSNL
jgi:hypothetical protein